MAFRTAPTYGLISTGLVVVGLLWAQSTSVLSMLTLAATPPVSCPESLLFAVPAIREAPAATPEPGPTPTLMALADADEGAAVRLAVEQLLTCQGQGSVEAPEILDAAAPLRPSVPEWVEVLRKTAPIEVIDIANLRMGETGDATADVVWRRGHQTQSQRWTMHTSPSGWQLDGWVRLDPPSAASAIGMDVAVSDVSLVAARNRLVNQERLELRIVNHGSTTATIVAFVVPEDFAPTADLSALPVGAVFAGEMAVATAGTETLRLLLPPSDATRLLIVGWTSDPPTFAGAVILDLIPPSPG